MRKVIVFFSLGLVLALAACATSPGNPGLLVRYAKQPTGDERVIRGVVNGIYKYDSDATLRLLSKFSPSMAEAERIELSKRYIGRVGYKKMPRSAFLLPITPRSMRSLFTDYVVLPKGWVGDPFSISAVQTIINVGDIIDVRVVTGRAVDYAEKLVRQCFENVAPNEKAEWALGCRTYEKFDGNGLAGEKYYVRPF
jgi:hypothetical protein